MGNRLARRLSIAAGCYVALFIVAMVLAAIGVPGASSTADLLAALIGWTFVLMLMPGLPIAGCYAFFRLLKKRRERAREQAVEEEISRQRR